MQNRKYKTTTRDGKGWLVHRLVWTEANGEIPESMVIHHINGDTHDNRLENLDCITQHENMQRADRWGLGFYKSRQKRHSKRPYHASRRMAGVKKFLGMYGTPCGAFMAYRLAYVNA